MLWLADVGGNEQVVATFARVSMIWSQKNRFFVYILHILLWDVSLM
ncbi:hypothetical protein HMPREF0621_0099 [Pasteurella dagmatis ATCC 43325]|uniref:Uncharacterized protein n=1 Tax=Pasteurella dagmatis ATCC 43325 TaxID=667128 RepID=C9PM75_9PAST|nr:hypothetical protein HMPREF0621_0099 [Pasteurella dagmatis ATCC 43325]